MASTVDFVLCEDDSSLRAIVGTLVEARGHTIVGETDSAYGAGQLVSRVRPDAVITDLALLTGSGLDVLRAAEEQNCYAIVYSAYCDEADLSKFTNRPIAVEKPNFDGLEAAIDALARRHSESGGGEFAERRTNAVTGPGTTAPPVSPIEQAEDFYRALGDAWSGDGLLAIDAGTATDAEQLAVMVRLLIRAQDHIMERGCRLVVLLIGGSPHAPVSVTDRVNREWAKHADKQPPRISSVLIGVDESPSDAYIRLEGQGSPSTV
jgi:CheY-like chemotaxis protein